MVIKAEDVKRLRDRTGAGMMDCKKALVEAAGDFAKAQRILKELGLAAARKKSGRATNNGKIFSKLYPGEGILLELTSETDFVARNSLFTALGEKLVETIHEKQLTQKTEELELLVSEAIGKIKENLELKRFTIVIAQNNEALVEYVHNDRIGVLLKFKLSDAKLKDHPRFQAVAFDSALHVTAFAPLYLSRDKVDQEYMKEQEDIFRKQTEGLDKPENVLKGIVQGKLNKHFAEVCFLEQPFVKDEKRKVAKVLEELGKEIGGKVEPVEFVYYKLGENDA